MDPDLILTSTFHNSSNHNQINNKKNSRLCCIFLCYLVDLFIDGKHLRDFTDALAFALAK